MITAIRDFTSIRDLQVFKILQLVKNLQLYMSENHNGRLRTGNITTNALGWTWCVYSLKSVLKTRKNTHKVCLTI
jgi:hypothetical protein